MAAWPFGPESTIEYYRLLVAHFRKRYPDEPPPAIIINSIDAQRVFALLTANDRAALTHYLVAEFHRPAGAGAEVGLIGSNTPHLVFVAVQRQVPFPLVSMVDAPWSISAAHPASTVADTRRAHAVTSAACAGNTRRTRSRSSAGGPAPRTR